MARPSISRRRNLSCRSHRRPARPPPATGAQAEVRTMDQPRNPSGPLTGIRVLEFSQIVAGPVAGLNLADLGADVSKVEPPAGDSHRFVGTTVPGDSKMFQGNNRGKRSLVVDLQRPDGLALIRRLIPSVDVVISNFRLGVPERLGIDYASLTR